MEIARVMIHDNLSFMEAERNISPPRIVPAKSLRKFPLLPMEAVIRRERIEENPSYRAALDRTKKVKETLSDIVNIVLADRDAEILCNRNKKTVEVYAAARSLKSGGNNVPNK